MSAAVILQDTIKPKVKADVCTNNLPPQDLTAFWDKTRSSIMASIAALSDRLSPVPPDTVKQKAKADVPTNTLSPQDLTAFWDKTRLSIKSSIDTLSDQLSPIAPAAQHAQVIFILIQTKPQIL